MSTVDTDPVWLQTIVEHLPTAVVVTDAGGRTLWVNRAFTTLTGFELADLAGRSPGEVLQGPGTCEKTVRLMRGRLQQGLGFSTTVLNYDREGRARHIGLEVQPVSVDGGRPTHFVALQHEMADDGESVRLAMSSARQGVWQWDRGRRSLRIGDEFLAMLGLHEPVGRDPGRLSDLVVADDRPAVVRWFRKVSRSIDADQGVTFRIKAPTGQIYWLEARGRGVRTDDRGRFETASGVFRDITQAKASERAMEHLAYYDPLTGLPNRRTLDDRLARVLERAARDGRSTAVLFIDLDGFKQINDLFGHAFGDSVLCTVAQRLQSGIREHDLVGRISGDEFLVVIDGFDERDAISQLARRLIDSIREPVVVQGQELLVGASIGISLFPDDGLDSERLIRLADLAMYEVKQSGRLGYRFFEQSMNDIAAHSLQVETRLRLAVKTRTLDVQFQPLVDAGSRSIVGAEALVRWVDPVLGRIGPDQFIPVAERLGLIHALGESVLERAALLVLEHRDLLPPGFVVSVNVSPVQLGDPQFMARVNGVLDRTGVDPQSLMFEVTESALTRDPKRARTRLEQIKQLGLGVAIDDFGTGYSSLVALRDMPIDKLKIDRSFVSEIETNARTRAIVEAMIDIGRRLSMCVNAEGVETESQAAMLREAGCTEFQGYLFAKPLSETEFVAMAARERGITPPPAPRRQASHVGEPGSARRAGMVAPAILQDAAADVSPDAAMLPPPPRQATPSRSRPPLPQSSGSGAGSFELFDWPADA